MSLEDHLQAALRAERARQRGAAAERVSSEWAQARAQAALEELSRAVASELSRRKVKPTVCTRKRGLLGDRPGVYGWGAQEVLDTRGKLWHVRDERATSSGPVGQSWSQEIDRFKRRHQVGRLVVLQWPVEANVGRDTGFVLIADRLMYGTRDHWGDVTHEDAEAYFARNVTKGV